MAESTRRRRTAPKSAPDEAPDPNVAVAESFGQQQRDRVGQLERPPDDADLYERIAWILENVPDVPKLGHAEVRMKSGGSYTYDFVREPEMMNAIRPLLGRAKVAAFPSIEDVVEQGGVARTVMTLTFVHGEQRETIKFKIAASDTGDRAIVKTLTTGMRYLLQKQFQIATDGIDQERENIEPDRPAPARAPRPAAPRRAAGKPSDLITPQTRMKITEHARSLFIADERVLPILQAASGGQLQTTEAITTNEAFDWALRQLDRYAADPEAGEQAIAEAGIGVVDRTKLADDIPDQTDPEADDPYANLTQEEMDALNAPD